MSEVTTAAAPAAAPVALPPRALRIPILLAVVAVVTLVVFGLLGRDEPVRVAWSSASELITLPSTVVVPRFVGYVAGILAVLAAGLALWRAQNRQRPIVWLSVIVGVGFLVSIVTWVGAGGSVPVGFLLSSTLALSTAIVLGALAGVIGERVGIVNIAIEAQLLGGAFTAAFVASVTGNDFIALVAAMVVGALISMVLGAFAIVYLVDQVIVGVVLVGLVTAVTNFLYSVALGPRSQELNDPGTLPKIEIPLLSDIPVLGPVLFDQRLTTYLMFILVPLVWFILFKTRTGLRIRALGEHPLAADTVGIKVNRWRFWTLTSAGLIAGLGGAALSIGDVGAFVREMSSGQGFIALACVILGRWHPVYASLAALLFGFATTFRVWAGQESSLIPSDLIKATPYVVTVLAVALVAGRVLGPKAAGKPYVKE